MKRFITPLVLATIASASAFAQSSILNNPDNKAYFGIRIGGEVTCPGNITVENVGVDAFKNGGGFEIGGIYNLPIAANFYLEPGLKFYYNTYSLKNEMLDGIDEDITISNMSIRKFGMRIPVMAGYHFDFTNDVKVSVFTGPELEVGFSGKGHIKGEGFDLSESIYGDDGGMKRVDLLWGIGAGVSYKHLYFGVSGGIGMLNMIDDSYVKFHENRVTFSVGYNF